MDAAKIRLSPTEIGLVSNAGWILTKNAIIQKTIRLFSEIQSRLEPLVFNHPALPAGIANSSPRISKGENYQGLPWVVLDYPRHFDKENIFAIRTMFWWGNFFSCTLHLSGQHLARHHRNILRSFDTLQISGYFICINEDQWEHHFEIDNYIPVADMRYSEFETVCNKNFLKLAKKIPIENWNETESKLPEIVGQLINVLNA
jgi:hypothetical protein